MLVTPTAAPVDDPPLAQAWWRARTDGSGALDGLTPGAVLRHVVGRRVTVSATGTGEPVVIKVFVSPRARGNARRLRVLASAGMGDVIPSAVAESHDGQVGVLTFREGCVMDEADDVAFVAGAGAAGAALWRLHTCDAEMDRRWTHADEVAQLVGRSPVSCSVAAAQAAARCVDLRVPLVPSHRDLHPRQVVLSGRDVGFIDLDDCALAPPGLDVGNMVAHLRREAVIGRRPDEVADRAVSAFLTGYGSEPPDLDAWVDLALARLASLAETRHGRPAERDALLAELDGGTAPSPPVVVTTTLRVLQSAHLDRPVRLEERDGTTVVVKTYHRTDGAAIHEAMAGLWSSPLGRDRPEGPGMPEPLGFDARADELTMSFVPGDPLGDRGRVGGGLTRGVEVGRLLADLHGSGVVVDRVRDRRALARSVARKVAEIAADPTTPAAVVDAFVEASLAVERAWTKDDAPRRHVLSHGDLSPRNVLVGPRGLVLIDFDRVQMAEPERDLAYWAAWTWVTQGAHGWPDTAALLGDLVSGYAARARRTPADRASLEVHLAVGLVRIAHGWTVLRRDAETQIRVLRLASALAGRHASPRAGQAP